MFFQNLFSNKFYQQKLVLMSFAAKNGLEIYLYTNNLIATPN